MALDDAGPGVTDESDTDRTCRYCLGGEEGGFIDPCACSGGQRWVHLECLRRWQRSILVTQPTHPDLFAEDRRMTHCTVCLQRFSCPLPSRHEMMLQFTGEELARLVRCQSLICSSRQWSETLQQSLQSSRRSMSNFVHWCRSAYLIIYCGPKQLALSIPDEANREAVLENLDGLGQLEVQGKRYRMLREGPLARLSAADASNASVLHGTLEQLTLPAEVILQCAEERDASDDSIRAINLCNPISEDDLSSEAQRVVRSRGTGTPLRHFLGGPCAPAQPTILLPAAAAAGCGLRTLEQLGVALATDFAPLALEDPPSKRRRLEAGDAAEAEGQALVFWGEARWQRTQLLGELARGDWGLCAAVPEDLVGGKQIWHQLLAEGRPVYAPHSEMTRQAPAA
ncbi:unnamed protein product [Effrenium voratum]|nr:unnamed protein product [Effrenium voratum]